MVSIIRGDDGFDSGVNSLKAFTSSEIAWAKDTMYTVNHTLGVVPKLFSVEYVCKSAIWGYAVGDTVFQMGERYSNWNQYVTSPTSSSVKLHMMDAGIVVRRKDVNSTSSATSNLYWNVRINLLG